jgi:outer membrane PBP1 activator LpoA protein
LDHSKLQTWEKLDVMLMEAELNYLQGNARQALAAVQEAASHSSAVSPLRRARLDDWQLRLIMAEEGALTAARFGDHLLLASEDDQQREQLSNLVWYYLQRAPLDDLQAQLSSSSSSHWRGWVELALLAADVMASPDVQIAQLALWQERHPDHAAANPLPGGMAQLTTGATATPGRMALLVPLGAGPRDRGRAVIEGFLAAQFRARQRGWPEQQVMIMDMMQFTDINAAYDSARRAGAELVIGPLAPESLRGWQPPLNENDASLLALTWYPGDPVPFPPPTQLGLSPEDEARQLARLAFSNGARKALVVRPVGDWGDRVSTALMEEWRTLEGEIRAIANYSGQEDYSSSLKAALKLSESEARATRLRRLMGEPTEFAPRRRDDLDVIFMLSSSPQDARSIKPLLAFHYAGNLPVYSTSAVFSGRRDPQLDKDLNGVRLLDSPWRLMGDAKLPLWLRQEGNEGEYADWHALGADAFILNWRLAQLGDSPEARVRGHSGLLNMDANGRIHRELIPARFSDGVPEPL